MRKCLLARTLCLLCVLMLLSCQQSSILDQTVGGEKPPIVENQFVSTIHIKAKQTVAQEDLLSILPSLLPYSSCSKLFQPTQNNQTRLKQSGLDRWYNLQLADSSRVTLSEVTLLLDPYIEYCELSESQISSLPDAKIWKRALVNERSSSSYPYNDPMLNEQWSLDNVGSAQLAEAGVGAFHAWEQQLDASSVTVAVLDLGVDIDHEDLHENMAVNIQELYGREGVDDDRNGYVDDVTGFNFVRNHSGLDAHDHGTHVAGIVAAVNNNGIGISSVAGGSGRADGVKILPLQIGMPNRPFYTAHIDNAFIYAADQGASICQCSWVLEDMKQSTKEAIHYFEAYAGSHPGAPMKGGLVIFSSGNTSYEEVLYPAALESVVAVASLNARNQVASYTTLGEWVDLSASGGDENSPILSTLPHNQYGYMVGTSMAAPLVSSMAALTLARNASPGYTARQLKRDLLQGVASIDFFDTQGRRNLPKLARADLLTGAQEQLQFMPMPPIVDLSASMQLSVKAKERDVTSFLLVFKDIQGEIEEVTLSAATPQDSYHFNYGSLSNSRDLVSVEVFSRSRWGIMSEKSTAISLLKLPLGIYPTVVKEMATISWGDQTEGEKELVVIDQNGRRVYTQMFSQQDYHSIDMRFLARGRYTVILKTNLEETSRLITKV